MLFNGITGFDKQIVRNELCEKKSDLMKQFILIFSHSTLETDTFFISLIAANRLSNNKNFKIKAITSIEMFF